jgi:cytochrome oxidase assembly protein ShyY1
LAAAGIPEWLEVGLVVAVVLIVLGLGMWWLGRGDRAALSDIESESGNALPLPPERIE